MALVWLGSLVSAARDASIWASLVPAILLLLVISYYYYYKNAFTYWQKRGVRGPRPWPLFGNMAHLLLADPVKLGKQWRRDFGKVYGFYESSKPVLAVADAEVLRQICIKDFNKFPNHHEFKFTTELQTSFLFNLRDDHWRKVRAILSPTFTSGKMRRMYKLLDVCADDLVLAYEEQLDISGPIVNLKNMFGLYTMDAIASCCYGLKLERLKGEGGLKKAAARNEFVKLGMKMFEFRLWRILAMLTVHEKILTRLGFKIIPTSFLNGFSNKVEQIIKRRRQANKEKQFDDYLQILLDAKLDRSATAVLADDEMDREERHHAGSNGEYLRPEDIQKIGTGDGQDSLSEIEIVSSAMFLLIVGLETTSTLLTSCFYTLAYHPEIQERLYETVKSMVIKSDRNHHHDVNNKNNDENYQFDYDTLTSCRYLDAVISETLRSLPPVLRTDRDASEDYHLASHDIHLPKGSKLLLFFSEIMNDPDYWPEPQKFDPERFTPENRDKIVPGSYCPFGLGPRHCLGMRFSLTESKLALAKMIMRFKFEPVPGLKYPPVVKMNLGFNGVKRPEVRVLRRGHQ